MFLSFTSSQVVNANATACLKNDKEIPHTPDTEETRPKIVQYTDGQEQVTFDICIYILGGSTFDILGFW